MCIAAWNNRITCSAGHARKKNGTSRGISRTSTSPVLLSKINSLHRTLTLLLTMPNRSKKDERVLPPPVDYTLLPKVVVQFKSGSKERGRKGGRNEMEISHKAWLTSTCGGASAFGAAITIFVFAAVGVASMRAGWEAASRGPSTATTARVVRKRAKGNGDNAARRSERSFALLPKRSIECPEEAKNGHGSAGRCRFKSLWDRS